MAASSAGVVIDSNNIRDYCDMPRRSKVIESSSSLLSGEEARNQASTAQNIQAMRALDRGIAWCLYAHCGHRSCLKKTYTFGETTEPLSRPYRRHL